MALEICDGDELGELEVHVMNQLEQACSVTTYNAGLMIAIKAREGECLLSGTDSTKLQDVSDAGIATFKDAKVSLAKSRKVLPRAIKRIVP